MYVHTHTYKLRYVCMYAYMHVCMYVCTYVCMYVCVYVCIYSSIYVSMYRCTHFPPRALRETFLKINLKTSSDNILKFNDSRHDSYIET